MDRDSITRTGAKAPWGREGRPPAQRHVEASIVLDTEPGLLLWRKRAKGRSKLRGSDRMPGAGLRERTCRKALSDMRRNAQEKRQLAAIKRWLEVRGYKQLPGGEGTRFNAMPLGMFGFRMNAPVKLQGGMQSVNIPIDAVVMPKIGRPKQFPVLIEAKSAGDFTNTNKRRKEEAVKMAQLRSTYGSRVRFNLFLCGYFDSGYLGYEAAEGIDWVWEHRIDDLALLGI